MANVLLGVTGSVAATRIPTLVQQLFAVQQTVQIVMTDKAGHFFEQADLPCPCPCWKDQDEWPSEKYQRGDPVLHIQLRDWADVFLIAPLTAHTLAKLANGVCDNLLTSVYRAWKPEKPIIIAPAMNTIMWQKPITARHLALMKADNPHLTCIEPIEKQLACGDTGIGAMAEVQQIMDVLATALRT
jgi:phosphopantothenoylcysteine decarboxylase